MFSMIKGIKLVLPLPATPPNLNSFLEGLKLLNQSVILLTTFFCSLLKVIFLIAHPPSIYLKCF